MSYTKRHIEDLEEQGININISDEDSDYVSKAERDADFNDFLRKAKRDDEAEKWLEAHPEYTVESGELITVRKSDVVMPVTKVETEVELEKK